MAHNNTQKNIDAENRQVEGATNNNDLVVPVGNLGDTVNPLATPPSQGIEQPDVTGVQSFLTPTQAETSAVEITGKEDEKAQADLFAGLFGSGSEEEQTFTAEEEAGIGELSKIDKDFFTQQVVQRRKFDRERQAVTEEKGLSLSQKQTRLNNVTRRQNFESADLALQKFVASNDLANAQSAVDRKLKAQFAGQRFRVEQLQFIADNADEENKAALKKVADKEEREFKFELGKAEDLESLRLSVMSNLSANNAPQGVFSAVSAANTPEDIYVSAGKFAGNPLDKAKLATEYLKQKGLRQELNSFQKDGQDKGFNLKKLSVGEEGNLDLAFQFKRNAQRMQEILGTSEKTPRELEIGQDEDSRTYRSIRADLVDILARDRTGAVVSASEEKTFKKILGVGAFRAATSDSSKLSSQLDRSVEKSNITMSVIDPTGEWSDYLDQQFPTEGQASASENNSVQTVNDIYIEADSSLRGVIESLYGQGISDSDVVEYLTLKNLI